jgi:hypothetical protein
MTGEFDVEGRGCLVLVKGDWKSRLAAQLYAQLAPAIHGQKPKSGRLGACLLPA